VRSQRGEIAGLARVSPEERRGAVHVRFRARDEALVFVAMVLAAGKQVRRLRRFGAREHQRQAGERLAKLLGPGDALRGLGEIDARAVSEARAHEKQEERAR
jgi:hypothetical protein